MKLIFYISLICCYLVIHVMNFCCSQKIVYKRPSHEPIQGQSRSPFSPILNKPTYVPTSEFSSTYNVKPEKNPKSSKDSHRKSSLTSSLLISIGTSTSASVEGFKKHSTLAASIRNKVTQSTLKTTIVTSEPGNGKIASFSNSSEESSGKLMSTDTLLKSIYRPTTTNVEGFNKPSTGTATNRNKVSQTSSKTTVIINKLGSEEISNSSTWMISVIVISSLLVMFIIVIFIFYWLKRRAAIKLTSKLNKLCKKNTSNKSGKSSNVESLHTKSHKICQTQTENSELSWSHRHKIAKKANTQLLKTKSIQENFKLSQKVANNFVINKHQAETKSLSKNAAHLVSSAKPKYHGTTSQLSKIKKLKSVSTKPNDLKKYYVTKSGVCDIEPVSYCKKTTSPSSQLLKLSKTQTPLTESQGCKSRIVNSIVYSNSSRKEDNAYEEVGGPFEVKNLADRSAGNPEADNGCK